MGHIIRNLVSFKAGWLACVLFAAAGNAPLAALSALAVVAMHLLWVPVPRKELLLIAAAVAIGFTWESLLVALGLAVYPGHESVFFAPYWIVTMWALFATTLNHGMRWTKKTLWLACVAGALGGPMAFYGGMKMGAVVFPEPALALAAIGLGWGLLLPLLTVLADSIIDMPWLEPKSPAQPQNETKAQPLVVGFE
jgi:hypothetical protein